MRSRFLRRRRKSKILQEPTGPIRSGGSKSFAACKVCNSGRYNANDGEKECSNCTKANIMTKKVNCRAKNVK